MFGLCCLFGSKLLESEDPGTFPSAWPLGCSESYAAEMPGAPTETGTGHGLRQALAQKMQPAFTSLSLVRAPRGRGSIRALVLSPR